MGTSAGKTGTVVTGVIGGDAHMVGNWVVQHALRKEGFKVVNIGVLSTQEEFIRAVIETNADAIWVSSLYGMGLLDCEGFRQKCREAGIGNILLYIGGNLMVGKKNWEEIEQKYREMGFDHVYPPMTRPSVAIADMKKDLGMTDDEGRYTE